MKNRITKLLASAAIGIVLVGAIALFKGQFKVYAADSYSQQGMIVNSGTVGATNYPTNGLYPTYIVSTSGATNIIRLGAVGQDDISIQVDGSATGASTTNVVFTFGSAVGPVTIANSTNIAGTSATNAASTPVGTFATATLVLNGTTPVSTNFVFSRASVPGKGRNMEIYLQQIFMGAIAGAGAFTNYHVYVRGSGAP